MIVEKSTVPVYTSGWIGRIMARNQVPVDHFDVVSNPEFLREGTAVSDFLHPDRIVVGYSQRSRIRTASSHLSAADVGRVLRTGRMRAGNVQYGFTRNPDSHRRGER